MGPSAALMLTATFSATAYGDQVVSVKVVKCQGFRKLWAEPESWNPQATIDDAARY